MLVNIAICTSMHTVLVCNVYKYKHYVGMLKTCRNTLFIVYTLHTLCIYPQTHVGEWLSINLWSELRVRLIKLGSTGDSNFIIVHLFNLLKPERCRSNYIKMLKFYKAR